MKVLYILPQPYLLPRGSSFRAMSTVDGLAQLGYEVDVVCYDIGKDPPNKRYAIHRSARPFGISSVKIGPSPAKVLFDIPLYSAARRLARRDHYDVIHGVEEAGFMAATLGRKLGVPHIYDMHSWMSQQIEGTKFGRWKIPLTIFKRMELKAMRGAGAIFTVGDAMTRLLQSSLAPGVHSATLPDCPLAFVEPPDPARREKILRDYFPAGRKTIVYTGNFHVYQGLDLLIESAALLKENARGKDPFAILIVGGGSGEKAAVERLRSVVKARGLEDVVVFCGEHPMADIPVFMERADLLVSSRISGNNVPLKIYTFLAAGVPMVATRITSHTQVLNDENCLLADPAPTPFADALFRGLYELTAEERGRIVAAALTITPEQQRERFREVLRVAYTHCVARS
jgi:glycosyltransferase involved in cell wall biosynthesis